MVDLTKYSKQVIVNAVQSKKQNTIFGNANMRMTKKQLIAMWQGKITESDLQAAASSNKNKPSKRKTMDKGTPKKIGKEQFKVYNNPLFER
jgi:predicted RNA-binding protein with PIN domain